MTTHPPTLSKPSAPPSGTDHDALPPGTRFGEFEILRVLGVGGFGIVYLAQDHSLEREVALKEYMPASLAARGAGPQITVRSSSFAETYAIGLRSFINEARLLARFDHPSLVKVYRFWEDNATAYMVMPFLQGVTLRDTRRGMAHAPDEAWIRSVLTPILSALELLHREGVYHRDIAPDNILLPRDGPPVLLDFGAARRVISDRTQSLTAILKPSYAPIEQYAEMTQLRQGPWTDIYALGAVVHFLLFGVPPAPATARAVQDDGEAVETRIVPGVSPRFLEAMSWMLAIRPNNRPQSGEQLRAVLDGRAEIPVRGRPGVTIPGSLSPLSGPQIEQATDATRINTAYLPTHMPTARIAPPAEAKTTTFSPTAPMPTARATTTTDLPPTRGPAAAPTGVTKTVGPASTSAAAAGSGRATTAQPPSALPAAKGSSASAPGSPGPAMHGKTVSPPASSPRGVAAPAPAPGAANRATASREGPPSQAASWAASRPPPLPPAASGPQSGSAPLGSPMSRPAPLSATANLPPSAARAGSSKTWLVMAGGGLFVAVAAFAAWQFSARGPTVATAPAATASAAASAGMSSAQSTDSKPASTAPIAVETPPPATSVPTVPPAITAKESLVPASAPSIAGNDAGQKAPIANKTALADGAGAASAPRVRPVGKPVPRVGDDPALASGTSPGTGPIRSSDPPSPFLPNTNGTADRSKLPAATTTARDYPSYQRPPTATESGPQSISEVCKGSFFERNVCMDERCEEARFRSTSECVEVLQRKRKRGGG